MPVNGGLAAAAITAIAFVAGLDGSAPALASEGNWGLNGSYAATSLGDWAKTNERYQDEATIRSIWTISTTCVSPVQCTGTVTSDLGWSANVYTKTGLWYLKRTVDNWEPCRDGTSADATQMFRFYGVDSDGTTKPDSTTYAGEDITTGPSGACGRNLPLVIRMPFKLEKLS